MVHVLLLRDGMRILDTTLPLGTSEESQYKAPPRPGERGHWTVDLDLDQPGSYALVVWTGTGTPPGVSSGASPAPAPAVQQTPASTVESDSKTFVVS